MRVVCRHGHFAFYPRHAGEISQFCSYFDEELVSENDYYTFPFLKDAPRYSLTAKLYLNLPAIETYEGRGPWDVFRENNFVYHIATGLLVPKLTIPILINPRQTGHFFLAESPLIQPGSRNALGEQILSYEGEFVQDSFQLRVSEFSYE